MNMPYKQKFKIAYILKGYPRLSETFIANEIHLLEEKGLLLHVYSVKKPGDKKVHPVVEKTKTPVTYLPKATLLTETNLFSWLCENFPNFAPAHKLLFKSRPKAYCRTLLQAIRMGFKYRDGIFAKPKRVFIKEFLQAGYIALEILRSGQFRHLHGHYSHGSTTITMFVSKLTGLPFSFTAHAKDIYQKSKNPTELLKIKLHAARFVVTCTEANKQYLQALCSNEVKVNTIYHGLDTRYFSPGQNENSDQPLMILSVGRFVAKKGFVYLVEACRKLQDMGIDFKCQIVGAKDEHYELTQQMIQSLGLRDTVILKSEMTQNELKDIYQTANIFALPCQIMSNGDRDGIPNVLVEAMAMGIPVVSTDISGIPELIHHEKNGLLIPQRDPDALADALRRLLQDEGLRKKLGQASRETICSTFDSDRTSGSLKQLFETTLQSAVPV